MSVKKVTTSKVTVTMKNELLARCDEEAESLGMTRSAFITWCVSQYFKKDEAIKLLQQALEMCDRVEKIHNALTDENGNTYYENLNIGDNNHVS